MTIKYDPPVLKNFGEDYKETVLDGVGSPLHKWKVKHQGQFVLSALEDTITVWALGGDLSDHSYVRDKYKVNGRVLGGGTINVDDKGNSVHVSGGSRKFGSLPNKVLEKYFLSFGYRIKTEMLEGEDIQFSTRKWFKEHGIYI
jgi:hypothetical protein